MNLQEVFRRDWPTETESVSVCLAVYEFLVGHQKQNHYSFAQMREIAGTTDDSKLARVLTYLSNPSLKIVKFIFFFESEDDMEEIERDDDGAFRHPFSGDELDAAHLLLGFEAGELILQADSTQ